MIFKREIRFNVIFGWGKNMLNSANFHNSPYERKRIYSFKIMFTCETECDGFIDVEVRKTIVVDNRTFWGRLMNHATHLKTVSVLKQPKSKIKNIGDNVYMVELDLRGHIMERNMEWVVIAKNETNFILDEPKVLMDLEMF